MKIDLSFSALQFDELQLREKNVIVVDVLRASTTVIVALSNGAREIIPVASIESAVKISGSLFGEVTLRGGERNGKIIEGFNLGNSPREYTESTVRGKSIIFCTTNGSVAMAKSRYAKNMAVGSFVNMAKVVDFVKQINADFWIVCAGKPMGLGSFSMEDAVCAGMMIERIQKSEPAKIELSDSSRAAQALFKAHGKSILKMMKSSDHGQYLKSIGFEEDIALCAGIDTHPFLPVLSGNVIKLRKDEQRSFEADVAAAGR